MRYKENKTSCETRKREGVSKLKLFQVLSSPHLGMTMGHGGIDLWLHRAGGGGDTRWVEVSF